MCSWFLMCGLPATRNQFHPLLGQVPICDRCQQIYNHMKGGDSINNQHDPEEETETTETVEA
jgi:hypothetical protein